MTLLVPRWSFCLVCKLETVIRVWKTVVSEVAEFGNNRICNVLHVRGDMESEFCIKHTIWFFANVAKNQIAMLFTWFFSSFIERLSYFLIKKASEVLENFPQGIVRRLLEINHTMSGKLKQDSFGFPFDFGNFRLPNRLCYAWVDSGAGIIPSVLANNIPASKVSSCGMATASISLSLSNWLTITPAPW